MATINNSGMYTEAELAIVRSNSYRIRVDVEQAKATLTKLEALASDIRSRKSTAQSIKTALGECWQGESGSQIQDILSQWITDQEALVSKIEESTANIRKSVQAIADTDARLAASILC